MTTDNTEVFDPGSKMLAALKNMETAAASGGDGITSCVVESAYRIEAFTSGANSGYAGPSVEPESP